ncbi:MAG: alkaline phosphatase [Limisphaerales bacterium]|jgi:predicted AlkP superfamily pyrophosphatase or phosphodiesterase|nr:alkaline phosphatase [Verrucomicrobiota bacterium]
MKRLIVLSACLVLAFCQSGCQSVSHRDKACSSEWRPEHVIFIGFDGLCAKSLRDGADMPTLRHLMAEGSHTLESRTILPSSSACNWASIFMGSGIELHGYTTWGSKEPDLEPRVVNENGRYPDVFWEYRKKNPDAEIGYIYEWDGMGYLTDPAASDFRLNTKDCTTAAVEYIKEKKPNLCGVIYDQPDGVGHSLGWRSPEYMAKILELDGCLKQILDALEEAGILEESVVIVTSDHGGIDKGHGGMKMEEMQRPLVFYGKSVKKGYTIEESTVVYDLAATMAWLLDVERPQVWTGRPISSVFEVK